MINNLLAFLEEISTVKDELVRMSEPRNAAGNGWRMVAVVRRSAHSLGRADDDEREQDQEREA